jgi:PAS domain S-box-containing protein
MIAPSHSIARRLSVILIGLLAAGGMLFDISHFKTIALAGILLLTLSLLHREDFTRTNSHEAPGESGPRFHSTLENLIEGCQIVDRNWRYLYLNPAAARHGKRTVDELLGRTMMDAYPGIEQTEMFRVLRRSMETRTAGAIESEFVAADGSTEWFDLVIQPVPEGLFILSLDITQRKRAQDDLRESERRFRDILANLHLTAMMLDTDARITYCNDELLRLTGWNLDEVLGKSWFEVFIPEQSTETLSETFADLIADRPRAWHHENEILTRSGKRLRIQWNNSVLRSASGEVIGTASIGEDVTERKRLEKHALRAQRLESLGTLAGGIAHDLNNLLMPILMGVAMLKRFEPGERSMKAIENIEKSVKRGSDLAKQVLLFARGGEASRDTVQVEDVVREVEAMALSTFPKRIELAITIERHLWPVTGDATQLTQVLLNLCVNARDAMPHGGRISIEAENVHITPQCAQMLRRVTPGPYVKLEVTDTGEGIPMEIIDQIFDPFFTTKELGKGTGLGLSTTQGIVTKHGGFVTVDSTVGSGTSFNVYFPASIAEPPQVAVEGVGESLGSGTPAPPAQGVLT